MFQSNHYQINEWLPISGQLPVSYITFPSLSRYPELFHLFTTRLGGVSEGPYTSLNLGLGSDDTRNNIQQNYEILSNALSLDLDKIVRGYQTHTINIRAVSEENKGKLWAERPEFMDVDGLITDQIDIALMTFHADCIPIYYYDPVKKVIGMAHAGWRGTLANMAGAMTNRMVQEFGSDPADLVAVVGPSLGQCCFEVDPDVAEEFLSANSAYEEYVGEKWKEKYHIDLWGITKFQLQESGLAPQNVEISGLCTKCHQDLFFSHRGQKGESGRMVGMIMLKER